MTPKATLLLRAAYCCVFVIFTSLCCSAQTTVRPYEFGFTIEEQQHRHEMRDERGIVMGEFGFITADGIYHVTVYATDEEGRFRILAMKNYPYESPRKTIKMEVIRQNTNPTQRPIPVGTTQGTTTTSERPVNIFGQMACSSCFLPKKNKKTPKDEEKNRKTEIRPLSRSLGDGSRAATTSDLIPGTPESKVPKMIREMAKIATNTVIIKSTPKPPSKIYEPPLEASPNPPNYPIYTEGNTDTPTSGTNPNTDLYTPQPETQPEAFPSKTGGSSLPVLPSAISRTAADAPSRANPSKFNAKDTDTPKSRKDFGTTTSQSGADGGGDLYRFKYILDYNGHTETGSRNGNKRGSYYSIGDDNVERTVEYVANEFGFQPKIRWRKLSPNEIQAKENALKEYEFIWFDKP